MDITTSRSCITTPTIGTLPEGLAPPSSTIPENRFHRMRLDLASSASPPSRLVGTPRLPAQDGPHRRQHHYDLSLSPCPPFLIDPREIGRWTGFRLQPAFLNVTAPLWGDGQHRLVELLGIHHGSLRSGDLRLIRSVRRDQGDTDALFSALGGMWASLLCGLSMRSSGGPPLLRHLGEGPVDRRGGNSLRLRYIWRRRLFTP